MECQASVVTDPRSSQEADIAARGSPHQGEGGCAADASSETTKAALRCEPLLGWQPEGESI